MDDMIKVEQKQVGSECQRFTRVFGEQTGLQYVD